MPVGKARPWMKWNHPLGNSGQSTAVVIEGAAGEFPGKAFVTPLGLFVGHEGRGYAF